jgi:hypothetical protein
MERLLGVLEACGPRLFRLLKRLTLREDVAEVLLQSMLCFRVQEKFGERWNYEILILADPRTKLPTRLEVTMTQEGREVLFAICEDFQYNVPLDESLFDTTPPPGYRVTVSRSDRPVSETAGPFRPISPRVQISVAEYVQSVIEQHAVAGRPPRVSLDELDATLDEMAEDSEALPVLPAEAYSRESIYGEC